MTKEQIINHLRYVQRELSESRGSDYSGVKALEEAIKELASVENKGEWIPVTKRLPEEDTKVYLVCCADGYIASIMYSSGRWLLEGDDIIAWMPLPEPYIADEEK